MDHYQTLGVAKTATPEEIKKAYRKLASIHHPDKGGDTATFQKIQTAYDTLSNHEKRQQYDNPSPFQDFGQGAPGGFSFHSTGGGFDDLFQQFFRQAHGQHHPRQPQQQVYRTTINVTLEQVLNGGEQTLKLQTPSNVHMVKVDIPKGVPDGGQVRIDNVLDNASLMVEFRVSKHLKFDRVNYDLVSSYPISVLDLITGSTFEFTTLSGKTLEVTVRPCTQPNVQLKIAKEGLPVYANPNQFGDQIILLKPFIPDKIDEQIINAIQQTKGVK